GVALELPSRRRQAGAGLVAQEQHAAELLFQRLDARADRRLADVEPPGGAAEVAGRDDGEEGAGEFGIQAPPCFISTCPISSANGSRLPNAKRGPILTQ